jgi:nitroimidazol reductase NimA-like FMN-containing flavoprotein (pyridoxamine 5'-phosphate oxidase superfamily)
MAYHMRRTDREITDPGEIDSVVAGGTYAICALCRDDEPYVVTLSYGFDATARTLYFHCAKEGTKLDFIRTNPAACITIIDDLGYIANECSHAYRSVVLRGNIEFVEDETERMKAIRTMIDHYKEDNSRMMSKIDPGAEEWRKTQMLRFGIGSVSAKMRPQKKMNV